MRGLFRAVWYRSQIEIKDETMMVPVPPFETYNPFSSDLYISPANSYQKGGKRSLYLEFLTVKVEKIEEVKKFCERFGVLGEAFLVLDDHRMRETKVLKNQMKPSRKWNKATLQQIQATYLTQVAGSPGLPLLPPQKLCRPMSLSKFQNVQELMKQVLTSPTHLFAGNINHHLYTSRVSPNLHWNIEADHWEILWHSQDLQGILFFMAMLDSLGEGTMLSCPKCGQFFCHNLQTEEILF